MALSRRGVLSLATVGLAATAIRTAAAEVPALTGEHVTLASGRSYWLCGAISGTAPRPLLLGLPGTGLSAQNLNLSFWSGTGGWQNHAAAHNYALALCESSGGTWNVGGGWPSGGHDDRQYLQDVVAHASRTVSPSKVFTAGFSAGGAMAWAAAAARPDVFAACGMASGWAPIRPTTTMDCYHLHGTSDTTVPIRGGTGVNAFVFPPAADEALHAPRGSRVVLYATSGGHAVPGWAAARLFDFFVRDRLIP